MARRLNVLGKIAYLFTSLFPLYLFWFYFYVSKLNFKQLNNFQYLNSLNIYLGGFFLLCSIISPIIFYGLIKNKETSDTEILVKNTKRDSRYAIYFLGAISPFLTFLLEFLLKNSSEFYMPSIIVSTILFSLGAVVLIFKDEYGILYNVFFLRYNFLSIGDKVMISDKNTHSGYVKVIQLNNKVYKKWN